MYTKLVGKHGEANLKAKILSNDQPCLLIYSMQKLYLHVFRPNDRKLSLIDFLNPQIYMFCHITAVKMYQEMNLFTGEHLLNISCFKIYMHIYTDINS